MERGSWTAELRHLDPRAGRTSVRAEALAGLVAGLEALVQGEAAEHADGDGSERVVLAAGRVGAVACVAPVRSPDEVAVVHSVAPDAVAALAGRLGVTLPAPGGSRDDLRVAVVTLLRALDGTAWAARAQAAHRLHDGPVQELTAAQLVIESAVPAGGAADPDRAHRGMEMLRGAILSCRQLMAEFADRRSGPGA